MIPSGNTIKTEIDVVEKILGFFVFYSKISNGTPKNTWISKIISILFATLVNAGFVYNICALIRLGTIIGFQKKTWIVSLFTSTISISLWHISYFKRKSLGRLIRRLRRYSYLGSSKKHLKAFLIGVLTVQFSLPLLYAGGIGYVVRYIKHEAYFQFWLVGSTLDGHQGIRKLLLPLCFFVYFTQQFVFPGVITLIFCVLMWRVSDCLKNLKLPEQTDDFDMILRVLEKRRKLKIVVCDIEKNFSISAFLLISYSLVSIFSAATVAIGLTDKPSMASILESSIILVVSFSMFMGLIFCASKIPKSFYFLKENLRDTYQHILVTNSSLNAQEVQYMDLLNSVVEEIECYVTAWGVVKLDTSVILNSLGALITYGILAIQFSP